MCVYIGIEDLAANALIEILNKTEKNFVTYAELECYGAEVVNILNEQGEKAMLILSRESTNNMFRNYSDIFEEKVLSNDELVIALREGKNADDLIEKFRGYLAWDVLLAFVNKKSLAKLGVVA